MPKKKILWLMENVDRIGHLILEPFYIRNCFCERNNDFMVMIPGNKRPGNRAALSLVRRHFQVMVCDDPKKFFSLFNHIQQANENSDEFVFMNSRTHDLNQIYARKVFDFEIKPWRYAFSEEDRALGQQVRERFKIPDGAKIAVIHNREAGYLPNLTYHGYRDGDIQTYLPAIKSLVDRNYFVVRVGDTTMAPLPKLKNVIDLPFHGERTDFADLWFLGTCSFFLGGTSGPKAVPLVFGRPCVIVNMINGNTPFGHRDDMFITKELYAPGLKRKLTFQEMESMKPIDVVNYDWRDLKIINNTEQDILELVNEVADRVEGSFRRTEAMIQRQSQFRRVLKQIHGETGCCIHHLEPADMGDAFLKKNPYLMGFKPGAVYPPASLQRSHHLSQS